MDPITGTAQKSIDMFKYHIPMLDAQRVGELRDDRRKVDRGAIMAFSSLGLDLLICIGDSNINCFCNILLVTNFNLVKL